MKQLQSISILGLSIFISSYICTEYQYIKKFTDVCLNDIAVVGGKNASLGELINNLSQVGIRVPDGFAITVDGYQHFLTNNNLHETIKTLISNITDINDLHTLKTIGQKIRSTICNGKIPHDLSEEIIKAYMSLSRHYNTTNCKVAVRSSATAEDLPDASFAGQQDTYLNVSGVDNILQRYKECLASLFTDRAIAYRIEKNFDHLDVSLSVGVQKMVRSDLACSGVAFSLDTETGFSGAVIINSSYGLGENIVQGNVNPDEHVVFKEKLLNGYRPIIKKELGLKDTKMIFSNDPKKLVEIIDVPHHEQQQYCLTDDDVLELARMIMTIEHHYSGYNKYKNRLSDNWVPMDVEWAKDGIDGKIYITQARPETVHSCQKSHIITTYTLKTNRSQLHKQTLCNGVSIGQHIAHGRAKIIHDVEDITDINSDDIIITQMTDPNWVLAMRKAAGIITNKGGRTCHAAIVSRELEIPAIVGTQDATQNITNGQLITLDCAGGSTGFVYDGHVPFIKEIIKLDTIPKPPVKVMVNLADPSSAFRVSQLPTSGIGLARLEFIISNSLKVHPMALLHPEKITDSKTQKQIADITACYENGTDFFVDQLAVNIGMIAAAFYPRPVIVRMSDFKSNEYRNLIGGKYFEPEEENPMLGFRGACRYYHPLYKEGIALECASIKQVRETMGLYNVKVIMPFVRSLEEAE